MDLIKPVHMACAAITITLFGVRWVWMIAGSPRYRAPWTRVVPPTVDTVLLLTGVYMITQIEQYPLVDDWLTAKLTAVLVYVLLGITTFRARAKRARVIVGCLAFTAFAYVVFVARTKELVPWG